MRQVDVAGLPEATKLPPLNMKRLYSNIFLFISSLNHCLPYRGSSDGQCWWHCLGYSEKQRHRE